MQEPRVNKLNYGFNLFENKKNKTKIMFMELRVMIYSKYRYGIMGLFILTYYISA